MKNDVSAVGAVTNGDDNGVIILTPPNTTPSTPAQRMKNVSSNSPDIMQGVILRSPPQMTTSYGTLSSPVPSGSLSVNSGQSPVSDPETPISSPEFASEYI